jgi:hypothetical protein
MVYFYDFLLRYYALQILNALNIRRRSFKVLSDPNSKKPIEPKPVHVQSSTTNARTSPSNTTVAPAMEGRAYSLKKSKERQNNNSATSKACNSVDKQSELIKQIQRAVSIGKKRKR